MHVIQIFAIKIACIAQMASRLISKNHAFNVWDIIVKAVKLLIYLIVNRVLKVTI
jgi:hypothetical protein